MRQGEQPVIELAGVSFGYVPGRPVLRDVAARLSSGRLTVLVGPNASGKSTLMKLMLGHLPPDAGTVRLLGEPVTDLAPPQRARLVSYVPQRGATSFAYSVRQVVTMGQYVRRRDPKAVEAALATCGIADLADRVFAHLSGGQQQQVLIARALVQSEGGGRALLLDEPTSSLDLRHVHDLMAQLRRQADAGMAVLAVLHDLNLASRYADDVWLLDGGRLTCGAWDAVLDPARLSEIYRVPLERLDRGGDRRPLFVAAPEAQAGRLV